MYEIIARSFYMMENEIATSKLRVNPPDILIKPSIDNINMSICNWVKSSRVYRSYHNISIKQKNTSPDFFCFNKLKSFVKNFSKKKFDISNSDSI